MLCMVGEILSVIAGFEAGATLRAHERRSTSIGMDM